jgi:hypothetical protein
MKFSEIIRKIKNKFKKFFGFLSRATNKERKDIYKLEFNPVLKYSINDLEFEDEEFLFYSKTPN